MSDTNYFIAITAGGIFIPFWLGFAGYFFGRGFTRGKLDATEKFIKTQDWRDSDEG